MCYTRPSQFFYESICVIHFFEKIQAKANFFAVKTLNYFSSAKSDFVLCYVVGKESDSVLCQSILDFCKILVSNFALC